MELQITYSSEDPDPWKHLESPGHEDYPNLPSVPAMPGSWRKSGKEPRM